jgi:pimeloyl-ACP methyl ester carboxylesterase
MRGRDRCSWDCTAIRPGRFCTGTSSTASSTGSAASPWTYPGFGLSTAPPGYGYTIAEHSRVVEGFVTQLGLEGITPMVQDWGGPIGLWVAVRHPQGVQGPGHRQHLGMAGPGREDLRAVLQAAGEHVPRRLPGRAPGPVHQGVRPRWDQAQEALQGREGHVQGAPPHPTPPQRREFPST